MLLRRQVLHCADAPSTTAGLRFELRSFTRFIGEPLHARLNSSSVIASTSRAKMRAFSTAAAALRERRFAQELHEPHVPEADGLGRLAIYPF